MPPILPAEAFAQLVREHHAEVYRSARRIAANDADALDATQQVYLRALEGKVALGDARDRGRLLCWLAARTALAGRRGARTREEKEGAIAMEHDRDGSTVRPDDEAARAEARAELQRQVARLPEELRTAIVLRFQERWTFAQIAGEQSISEPSAHDRVRRALERLRGELSRAGFAAVAADLPRELALEPGAPSEFVPPPAVPAGLERQLLALRASSALSASTALAAAVVVLASVVAVAGAAVWWPSAAGRPSAPATALVAPGIRADPPPATPPAVEGRVAVAGEAAGIATEPATRPTGPSGAQVWKGKLVGTCRDADRVPVPGVLVTAVSLQHQGKFARFVETAVTGPDGAFVLDVPGTNGVGEVYSLSTRHPDFVPHRLDREVARALATVNVGTLTLLRSSSDVAGEAELEVTVLDEAGAPVHHAAVSVLRRVRGPEGAPIEDREAFGATDASGRVALHVSRLGTKRLRVEPPAGELGPASLAIGIDAPGRHERLVLLQRGLTISGTVIGLGGRRVVHGDGGFVAAFGGPDSAWIQADVDDRSGAFVLRGLEDRTYTIVRDGDEWSRVEIAGVPAGTTDLALHLKLETDVRDLGDHQAELHGEVRDASTGEVLLLGAFAVDAVPVGDVRGLDWQRDVLPTLIFPRPVQTGLFGEYVPPPAFHLDGLPPGTYAISARIDGYAPAFAGPFELGARTVVSGIVMKVERPAVLRGVLTDPAGRPLADGFARVTGWGARSAERDRIADEALRATRGQGAIEVWDDVRTDAAGRFEFRSLPPWTSLRLVVHHPDFEPAYTEALELSSGAATEAGSVAVGARR